MRMCGGGGNEDIGTLSVRSTYKLVEGTLLLDEELSLLRWCFGIFERVSLNLKWCLSLGPFFLINFLLVPTSLCLMCWTRMMTNCVICVGRVRKHQLIFSCIVRWCQGKKYWQLWKKMWDECGFSFFLNGFIYGVRCTHSSDARLRTMYKRFLYRVHA